jgi:hypothetical protein
MKRMLFLLLVLPALCHAADTEAVLDWAKNFQSRFGHLTGSNSVGHHCTLRAEAEDDDFGHCDHYNQRNGIISLLSGNAEGKTDSFATWINPDCERKMNSGNFHIRVLENSGSFIHIVSVGGYASRPSEEVDLLINIDSNGVPTSAKATSSMGPVSICTFEKK